jgi:hypothetical protein
MTQDPLLDALLAIIGGAGLYLVSLFRSDRASWSTAAGVRKQLAFISLVWCGIAALVVAEAVFRSSYASLPDYGLRGGSIYLGIFIAWSLHWAWVARNAPKTEVPVPAVELPVTLRVSRFMLCLYCVALVTGALAFFLSAGLDDSLAEYAGALLLAGLVPVVALNFHPKCLYLTLTAEGFRYCSFFRPRFIPWSKVGSFEVIDVQKAQRVAWDFLPGYEMDEALRKSSLSVPGHDAMLPANFNMDVEELAALMNYLREKYATHRARLAG